MTHVTGNFRVFATYGNPNRGNPAVAAYNAALEAAGVNAVYVALEPASIGQAMAAVRALGLGGGTVTKPFKQEVIQYLDEVDEDALSIGAVNVVVNRDGKLVGHNSDWIGAGEALRAATHVADRNIALLGAGGAARAIAYGLRKLDGRVTVFNRTRASADRLCRDLDCTFGGGLDAVHGSFDVIVNATSVGMGEDSRSPVGSAMLGNRPVVFDAVVRPRETSLLKMAASQECVTVPGIAMVSHLIAPTLQWLTGVRPPAQPVFEHFDL